jgi:uncharacterized protein YbaP (TraB family)
MIDLCALETIQQQLVIFNEIFDTKIACEQSQLNHAQNNEKSALKIFIAKPKKCK